MPAFRVDRLWPDPAADLDLDEAFADLDLPPSPPGRPLVGVNMVTSIDGRAQLAGTADGLSGRPDRRLLQLLRVAHDAVGSGVGTLRADDFYSHLPADLAERRVAAGRPAQPTAVVIGGSGPVPTDRRWFAHADQARILVLGAHATRPDLPAETEILVAPTDVPEPRWVLVQLAERRIQSFLLEGGPTTNATFLAADAIDELYWTIGARLIGTDALPMITPIPGGGPWAEHPRDGRLVSIHRSGDELFLRYRFVGIGP
ncbi:MAG: dihydrofolate reductase family protein [Chloroflexota bacterium]|nr:dihydrofolate reductase family protein [Chloroflexota bacterium]